MGRYYSDDTYRDFDRWDADQEAWLNSRPVCKWCGEHIQDEYAYRINGDLVCEDCLKDTRVDVEDIVEEKRWNSDY